MHACSVIVKKLCVSVCDNMIKYCRVRTNTHNFLKEKLFVVSLRWLDTCDVTRATGGHRSTAKIS